MTGGFRLPRTLVIAILLLAAVLSGLARMPLPARAATANHLQILIQGNAEFTSSNGVIAGSGTPTAPYIIANWEINASAGNGVEVRNTTASFLVTNVTIWSAPYAYGAISLFNVTNARVTNSVLNRQSWSLNLTSSANISISNSSLGGVQTVDASNVVVFNNTFAEQAYIQWSSNVTIERNSFSGFYWGIQAVGSDYLIVDNNTVSTSGTDILVGGGRACRVTSNAVSSGPGGIDVDNCPDAVIAWNTVAAYAVGINGWGLSRPLISGNDITGGRALQIENGGNATIINNTVHNSNEGGYLLNGPGNNIISNRFIGNANEGFGVEDWGGGDVVEGNFFSGNEYCGLILSSSFSNVTNNTFYSNHGSGLCVSGPGAMWINVTSNRADGNWGTGIGVGTADNVTVAGNEASENNAGIGVGSSYAVTVTDNNVSLNNYGIFLGTGTAARIYHNILIDNSVQAVDHNNSLTVWDNGYSSGGNYWSDYRGIDNCSGPQQTVCPSPDGIGDTPYSFNYGGKDRYPLMSIPGKNPPHTVASLEGNVGKSGWFVSSVIVTLTASPGSAPVSSTYYRLGNGNWSSYTAPIAIRLEGTYVVSYYSVDMFGDRESLNSTLIEIDLAPPVTVANWTCLQGDHGWCRSSVTILLTASDSASGVERTSYTLDGGPWHTYTAPLVVATDGVHELAFFSTDLAGNSESPTSLSVRIDTMPPTVGDVMPSGLIRSSRVTITWNGNDSVSGLADFEVSIDSAPFVSVGNHTSYVVDLPDGEHSVRIQAVDVAGNVAQATGTFTINTNPFSPNGPYFSIIVYALLGALCLTVIVLYIRRRKRPPTQQEHEATLEPKAPDR